jgi:signal transduction histidine kinase
MAEGLNNLNMDELQRISRSLRTSANQLFRLLENLLDWSRMEQGLLPFNPEAVQLQKVVDECISGIQAPANKKRIEILRRIPDGLIVFADINMLNTAIRNLVSNAVKFTPREGSIIISANPEVDNKVKISIKDTGIGMSRSLMDGLFQIEGKSTRKGTEQEPGTGLGLLLCKEFIEKHGGTLSIVSEVDQGSEFHFTLERFE